MSIENDSAASKEKLLSQIRAVVAQQGASISQVTKMIRGCSHKIGCVRCAAAFQKESIEQRLAMLFYFNGCSGHALRSLQNGWQSVVSIVAPELARHFAELDCDLGIWTLDCEHADAGQTDAAVLICARRYLCRPLFGRNATGEKLNQRWRWSRVRKKGEHKWVKETIIILIIEKPEQIRIRFVDEQTDGLSKLTLPACNALSSPKRKPIVGHDHPLSGWRRAAWPPFSGRLDASAT